MRHLPLLLLAGLALGACEKKATTVTGANGESVTVTGDGSNDQTMRITGTGVDGEKMEAVIGGEGSSWPANAPAEAPAYPGAKVTAVINSSGTGNSKGGGIISFETADAPAAVIDFYRAAAAKAGLKEETSMTTGDTRMITASGGDGHGLMVAVSKTDGKTGATLTFAAKGAK